MRWMGHIARIREMSNSYTIFGRIPEGKNHLRDLGVDERIILKWILEKWYMKIFTRLIWLKTWSNGRLFWTR
jgi:hypothetical protein